MPGPKRPPLELPLGLHRKNLAGIKIMPIAFGRGLELESPAAAGRERERDIVLLFTALVLALALAVTS